MKLSTRGRYGTRILLDMASHEGGPMPLKDIARRQQISLPYIERIVSSLVAGGLMRSIRGARGGVWLAKAPEEIRLSEVIQLLEGPVAIVDCINNPEVCNRSGSCATRDVWSELRNAMNGVLESITLRDLVERQSSKERREAEMYH
ncbi:RrF2 family transcriptional regulator, partial [Chloroflexota bacterium]